MAYESRRRLTHVYWVKLGQAYPTKIPLINLLF